MPMTPHPIQRSRSIPWCIIVVWIAWHSIGCNTSTATAADNALVRNLGIQSISTQPTQAGFTLLPSTQTAITFTNLLATSRSLTNQVLLNGSGVAAGDFDQDGWCDLYFCNLDGSNALYRNLGGWRFENVTTKAGVACQGMSSAGALFVDLDGDNDLDLLVTTLGQGTQLFLNQGLGVFTNVSTTFGLRTRKGGTSMAAADVNGDGFLEVYVANYRTSALSDLPGAQFRFKNVEGKQVIASFDGQPVNTPELMHRFRITERGGIAENGEEDDFYLNRNGTNLARISFLGGGFLDEAGQALTIPPVDWGLAVAFRDINNDGLPDLYVCNDFDSPDRIWFNEGGRRFRAAPTETFRKQSLFSMGVDFADINRDGSVDLLTVDMLTTSHERRMNIIPDRNPWQPGVGNAFNRPQYSMNMLHLNRGNGTFAEIAFLSGVAATEWSWCPAFMDVDLDGWEDLLVTNGHERDARNMDAQVTLQEMRQGKNFTRREMLEQRTVFPGYATHDMAFRNQHDLTFTNMSSSWGLTNIAVSHGLALADLDNDGDQDLVINHLNHEAGIYRNNASEPRISIRLKGLPPNTQGIGARILVQGGPVDQSQEMQAGGRYLSSDEPQRTFAASSPQGGSSNLNVEIRWRNGRQSIVKGLAPQTRYEISEPTDAPTPQAEPTPANPWFNEVTTLPPHSHTDEFYDDYQRQPTLPHKLSQLGPGVSWFDVNGDGRQDLIVAAGGGGRMHVFLNLTSGFMIQESAGFQSSSHEDQTTVLGGFMQPQPGLPRHCISGTASYETGAASMPPAHWISLDPTSTTNSPSPLKTFPPIRSSVGPLAMADVDGDGRLDLFLGGRVQPGAYPAKPESLLLHGSAQGFTEFSDPQIKSVFANAGMINGAAWGDLDNDGTPELVLATDWGPLRVFTLKAQVWSEITESLGLNSFVGHWNGIALADLDGDGQLDIAATNQGRNHKYQSHRHHPIRLYHGDWIGDGTQQMIESWFDLEKDAYVPVRQRDILNNGLPFIAARYRSNQAFADASTEQILAEHKSSTQILECQWTESTVFLNRPARFQPLPLPTEAQMATAFGIVAGDMDGDGVADLFLSQNMFTTQPESPRDDAGVGLVLKGKGDGTFTALTVAQSGVKIWGEQRGAAMADFDQDGRIDLAVGVNGEPCRLFRNRSARPGLVVRCEGTPENPTGIGVRVRAGNGERWEAVHEIQAGSGYWSQNSSTLVITSPHPITQLQVKWPHQKTPPAVISIPPKTRSVSLKIDGTFKVDDVSP